MPLILDSMRAEFARFLADDPTGHNRMDKALARVLTLAYERGLDDGRLDAADFRDAVALVRKLLDPEGFGHAVTQEVRNEARRALGLAK
jgi:hypothetical protein